MAYSDTHRAHIGWTAEETERLFTLAGQAQQGGRPLKSVFAEIAEATGRQPNSVRNFYYARVKSGSEPQYAHRRAFVPFSGEEADRLVAEILSAQAGGESVRSATLRLAGGDDTVMLRYQNKYRAMLKSDPARVRRIAEEMERRGEPAFDPFATPPFGKRRVGRPRKRQTDIDRMAECVLADLSHVEGLDVRALLDALGALAMAAIRGAAKQEPKSGNMEENEIASLCRELRQAQERYKVLLGYFTELMRINREFLSLNSVVKVSSLNHYVHDLESNVQDCERLVLEA